MFSFYSISLTPKFYYCSMSLHDQQPKLINTCIAYTRYLHELSSYRRLAKCFSESILNQANWSSLASIRSLCLAKKNNKGSVIKNGYKWVVLDLYCIRCTTVVHSQLIPLLTMYEDTIRLLLVKVGKYSEHLSNRDQLNFGE